MPRIEERPVSLLWAAALLVIVLLARAIQLVPAEIAGLLLFWILASLPLGIAIGHCALSEP